MYPYGYDIIMQQDFSPICTTMAYPYKEVSNLFDKNSAIANALPSWQCIRMCVRDSRHDHHDAFRLAFIV